ncbi:MAG: hemolysin III family protein [Pirellulales bacterium]
MNQLAQIESFSSAWRRSPEDEQLNAATHGFGFVAAVLGAAIMTAGVLASRNPWLVIGCEAYVGSLVAVYAMSTLSHLPSSRKMKSLFRRLDQAFIYLLIAGTYTPFSLAYLHGGVWRLLLAAMWGVALVGCASKALFAYRVEAFSVASYLMLAWTPVVALPALWRSAPLGAFESIIAGGICYSIGVWFLLNDERVPRFHAIWHICVIAGSACHFLGIFWFVVCGWS